MKVKQMILCTLAILFLAACAGKSTDEKTFTGTVMTGAQLGEVKTFVPKVCISSQTVAIL